MWDIRERDTHRSTDALAFGLGAVGGFALGILLSGPAAAGVGRVRSLGARAAGRVRGMGGDLRERAYDIRDRAGELGERARGVAGMLKPARLRRRLEERTAFSDLEDAVLEAFLADDVLSERGIDVGAISRGIIELSGSVWSRDEVERALRAARRIPGVETVVNRLDVEEERPRSGGGLQATGRNVGMGARRQGRETDPDRSDDSQHFRDLALEEADRGQYEDEDLAASRPRMGKRPDRPGARTRYAEDELDNQDPLAADGRGKHGTRPNLSQPQELNTAARVGEGPKPGTELRLEGSDVPVKPHSQRGVGQAEGERAKDQEK